MYHVVVEHHLAVRQRADRLAVLADVGDHHDPGKQTRLPRRAVFRRAVQVADFAEIAGDAREVLLLQLLAREDNHEVVEPGLIDRLDRLIVRFGAQVDAAQFRADMFGQGNNLEGLIGFQLGGDVHTASFRRSRLMAIGRAAAE